MAVIRRRDGRVIGKVQGQVFYKRIRGSKHILRVPPAIAVDTEALRAAEHLGAREVLVEDTENGTLYRASIAMFWEHGFEFNRGFGDQVGLPLHRWKVQRKGEPVQQALWGGLQ